MWTRAWLLSTVCVGLALPGLALQSKGASNAREISWDAHVEAVFTERRLTAEDAWSRADETGRARAQRVCNPTDRLQVPRVHARSTELYTRYARALTGMEFDRLSSPRQRFADSFDLSIHHNGDGFSLITGELSLTIFVHPLYPSLVDQDWKGLDELRLLWVDSEGEEQLARTTPTHGEAPSPGGFFMYVSAPAQAAGTWRLVTEWVFGEQVYRGWPVVMTLDEDGVPDRNFQRRDGLGGALGLLEKRLGSLLEVPSAAQFSADGLDVVMDIPEGMELRATVLLVLQRPERLQGVFAGEAGAGWARLAATGVRVLATLRGLTGEQEAAALALLGRQSADRPRVLVARGTNVRRLLTAVSGAELRPFNGLAVSLIQPGAAAPPALLAGLRSLFLEPLAGADREAQTDPSAPEQRWIQRAAPPVFAELELPELIDGWLPAGG